MQAYSRVKQKKTLNVLISEHEKSATQADKAGSTPNYSKRTKGVPYDLRHIIGVKKGPDGHNVMFVKKPKNKNKKAA